MMGRRTISALVLMALFSTAALPAQVITLRIAANVPANSPWDLGLQRMAAEFDRVSQGRVRVVFPLSARVATESENIRRLHLGYDGALLSTYGLAELYPDSLALSLPGFVSDDAEFESVLAAVEPLIRSKLESRYVLLALSKGGWIRYFSRSPIMYPSDLRSLRISMDPTSDRLVSLMQSAGAKVVTGSFADFLLQINSNTVDAIFQSPIFIATLWSFLRGKIGYMSPFKVSPFLGAMVINKASWERIPRELMPQLESIVADMAARSSLDSARLEEEAIASLDGIETPAQPPDSAELWAKLRAEWRRGPVQSMFSADILDRIDLALAKARSTP
jgi:TRAP-type transport system periplasmic protein